MSSVGSAPAGEELFLANLDLIERLSTSICRRNRLSAAEAEDFVSIVRLKFIEKDYEVLRKFQNRSKLSTYLTTVVARLFLDERNRQWGKWRPSALARRLGPLAMTLESLIHREGTPLERACETLKARHGASESQSALEEIARRLPSRSSRRLVGEEALSELPAGDPDPETLARQGEEEAVLRKLSAALGRAVAHLPPEDRLILRFRYSEGLTVRQIAQVLRREARPLYRRIEDLHSRLRESLEKEGFRRDDLSTIEDLAFEGRPGEGALGSWENASPRPSPGM
jgi:RNA polymerase sigma factor for flagellar operon FliA